MHKYYKKNSNLNANVNSLKHNKDFVQRAFIKIYHSDFYACCIYALILKK